MTLPTLRPNTPWMQSYNGKPFYFTDPSPDDIDLDTIAHGLAMQCRFAGHTKSTNHFYTIAQHCVMMSWIVKPEARLWALLHDAPEAYLRDVITPQKRVLQPQYGMMEDAVEKAILAHFNVILNDEIVDNVKEADTYMLYWEAERLLSNPDLLKLWDVPYPTTFVPRDRLYSSKCWPRGMAKKAYIRAVKHVLKEMK